MSAPPFATKEDEREARPHLPSHFLLLLQPAPQNLYRRGVVCAAQEHERLSAYFGLGVRARDVYEKRDRFRGGAAADCNDRLLLKLRVCVRTRGRLPERPQSLLA